MRHLQSNNDHNRTQAHSPLTLRPQSSRTERTCAVGTPQLIRLADARDVIAAGLDDVLRRHAERGNSALSNVAIGRRVGVSEKVVRGWRDGTKPMPAAALLSAPPSLRDDLIAIVQGKEPPVVVPPMTEIQAKLAATRARMEAAIARSKELAAANARRRAGAN